MAAVHWRAIGPQAPPGWCKYADPVDAFVIADRLRLGRDLPAPFHLDPRYFQLRLLTRYRYHVVHSLAREKAYSLAVLYLKASEYTRLKPFGDVFGAASRAVLQEFASLEAIAALPFEQLVKFIDVKGKRRFADPIEPLISGITIDRVGAPTADNALIG